MAAAQPRATRSSVRPRTLPLTGSEYTQLYDFAPVIWMVLDRTAVILDISAAGCEALGAGRRFIVGKPFRIWAQVESRPALVEHVRRCRAASEPVQTEIRLKSRKGPSIPVRLHSRRSDFRGRVVFPTVAVDITEQERLEHARRAAERERDLAEEERRTARAAEAAKDRLIATVSHELRNPLTPALVAASTLTGWPGLPDPVRTMAAIIKRNIELEARLIDDLLDLARATRGQLELRVTNVDVHEILSHAIETCVLSARRKHVAIVTDFKADRHIVRGDAARLEQVFWNLLNNAIKFSERGSHVALRTSSDDAGAMFVEVRDFGAGMDASIVANLFSPFEHPQTPVGAQGGLGLGLTIARGIVELHGGRIWAKSEGTHKGSLFAVELTTVLPTSDQDSDEPVPRVAKLPVNPSGGQERVLVVENHRDTGAMLTACLAQRGYDVTLVGSLKDGLAALDQPWDVVLSDIGLGDGSGLEIARALRKNKRAPVRLIALSGYGSKADAEASREAGFDAHLVKPVDLERLLEILRPSMKSR